MRPQLKEDYDSLDVTRLLPRCSRLRFARSVWFWIRFLVCVSLSEENAAARYTFTAYLWRSPRMTPATTLPAVLYALPDTLYGGAATACRARPPRTTFTGIYARWRATLLPTSC